ncbi:MAG: hypothetical protein QOI83_1102 [Streptomycetaceae bacterium]|nr:hypothetical protein [Streptomycetaceae bacterium]
MRHRRRHLGDTVCGDTPAPPPPARFSASRCVVLAVRTPGRGALVLRSPPPAGRHAPVRLGGDAPGCPRRGRAHAPRASSLRTRTCEPRGDHPTAAPTPTTGHGVPARTTTQPVQRLWGHLPAVAGGGAAPPPEEARNRHAGSRDNQPRRSGRTNPARPALVGAPPSGSWGRSGTPGRVGGTGTPGRGGGTVLAQPGKPGSSGACGGTSQR